MSLTLSEFVTTKTAVPTGKCSCGGFLTQQIGDKEVCIDCYWNGLGDLIEEHPIQTKEEVDEIAKKLMVKTIAAIFRERIEGCNLMNQPLSQNAADRMKTEIVKTWNQLLGVPDVRVEVDPAYDPNANEIKARIIFTPPPEWIVTFEV